MNIDISWLEVIRDKIKANVTEITPNEKITYWKMVGQLKRLDKPDPVTIEVMSEIREILYKKRFREVKPTKPILVLNTISALGIIWSLFVMHNSDVARGVIFSLISIAIFAYVYSWLYDFKLKFTIFAFSSTVVLTIFLDIIFFADEEFFLFLNSFLLVIVLPMMYLHGRYIGAKIAGIKIEGVNTDVFGLPTLKMNYKSYLSAKPPRRQWIFFFGGIGTVITSTITAILGLLYFNNPYLFYIPTFLFIGELIDYSGKASKLSGGEFNHLRREHKIISDWKKSLNN